MVKALSKLTNLWLLLAFMVAVALLFVAVDDPKREWDWLYALSMILLNVLAIQVFKILKINISVVFQQAEGLLLSPVLLEEFHGDLAEILAQMEEDNRPTWRIQLRHREELAHLYIGALYQKVRAMLTYALRILR